MDSSLRWMMVAVEVIGISAILLIMSTLMESNLLLNVASVLIICGILSVMVSIGIAFFSIRGDSDGM